VAKNRRRVDIIADILKTATSSAKKTRIMYIANLSYRLLEKYLDETINMGFVQASGNIYEITEKGRGFLDKYVQFSGRYSGLEDKLEDMRFEREVLERMCQPLKRKNPAPRTKRGRSR